MRIGHGFDVHRLTKGRPLILGGVTIPHPQGLAGHSDADVLLHAAADALLGAVGGGDIGAHFPDTDPAYKDMDSSLLLEQVYKVVREKGYQLVNIDGTILAQKPKMAPYIVDIESNIARVLDSPLSRINVKATTTETLGFTGREEGIAAHAVVLLESLSGTDE
ncbi:2-C-methyl-D-erythritol 2,4-cyclodiphosphate synthase [Salibacterium halotolerans]|uniref:2-C-methyl-D-erythritol 2,4-cyclodiphosphate synthase n=1 Tax=Salibacterium halotolerans TaxID=1884432 RepID=A0A1I5WCY6_9BACI|nr:2-C-methyl-D-erythritol 2,4-cyclodiphosphate synthase [Salibacterium halotolerans]SFQ17497.1 2-C-methyl-D-erythritol 2,4-cyclodiphosphate synthase [Salibacterium halotolerans]